MERAAARECGQHVLHADVLLQTNGTHGSNRRWRWRERSFPVRPFQAGISTGIIPTGSSATAMAKRLGVGVSRGRGCGEANCQPHGGWRGFAILNPGAGWGAKRWPAERYGEVAKVLAQDGLCSLINHGPGEEELAAAVEAASAGAARKISCSVSELIALTRRARLFIGGDTGPMHLAAALKIPVVAIFGPTNPARNGPFGTRSIVLRSASSMTDHARRREPEQGLLEITADEVVAAARKLLRDQIAEFSNVSEASQSGSQPLPNPRHTWSRVARRIRVPLGFIFAASIVWLARPTGNFVDCGRAGAASRAALARTGFRPRAKGQATHHQRALCLHAQPSVRRLADAGRRLSPSRRAVGGLSRSCS